MLVPLFRLALCALALGAAVPQSNPTWSPAERFWPQWRGPYATGVSKTATPPVEWSDTKNIRRKTEIPGRGSASPIVWGDRVYVLTAVPAGETLEASHKPQGAAPSMHKYLVLAIDRATGRTVWERTAREEAPHETSHPEDGRIMAVCDLDSQRVEDARTLINDEIHLYDSKDHHGNWLDCIRSRQQPISPVEVAHRACSACLLHHMAMKLTRKLYWDPNRERFKNDDDANRLLSRPQRPPYTLA